MSPGERSSAAITPGDILLICPPFAGIDRPSLGLHTIQAIARDQGLLASVYYANIHLARALGEGDYVAVAYSPPLDLLGERLFSQHAFPGEPFEPIHLMTKKNLQRSSQQRHIVPDIASRLDKLEMRVDAWLSCFRSTIRQTEFRVYGLSSMFAQNPAAVTLARIIRQEKPQSVIIVGGANCEGEMASGLESICPQFDYIFSGESEESFAQFCRDLRELRLPSGRIIEGRPSKTWINNPCPDFQEFFRQSACYLPESELSRSGQIFLPYETSRGCWWGQKHHCTFCGLNANGMEFRVKDSNKVVSDLERLTNESGIARFAMTDNIMPVGYFQTLIPQLSSRKQRLDIFYEQKSNLKRQQLLALKSAGVNSIQPGIEALSTSLLKRMKKGVSAAQNIQLLRHCRELEINAIWNLLYGFPGECASDYEETSAVLRSLVHLSPPNGFSKVSFDRFSPYFDRPDEYNIAMLRPHENYGRIYPSWAPVRNLAYHFVGDGQTIDQQAPSLVHSIRLDVQGWIDRWRMDAKPVLCLTQLDDGNFLLIDTRNDQDPRLNVLDESMARLITMNSRTNGPLADEALVQRWALRLDGLIVGLATTSSAQVLDGLLARSISERSPHADLLEAT